MIENLRLEIDDIDAQILKLFEKRMEVVDKIAEYKKENNMPAYDATRENEVLEWAKGASSVYSKGSQHLFRTILEEARSRQMEIHKLKQS